MRDPELTPELTRFVLLATQRTGGSWLGTLLDSHPRIATFGELFLDDGTPRPPRGAEGMERFSFYTSRPEQPRRRQARPSRTFSYLDELYQPRGEASVIGFKLTYDQLRRHPEIAVYLARRRVRVVHLIRENLLDVLISREVMFARGEAQATRDQEVRTLRVTLDERSVRRRLAALRWDTAITRRSLELLRIPHLEVSYERMLAGSEVVASVLRFLSMSEMEADALSSDLRKINSRAQSDTLVNYGAIAKELQGTRYASLLKG